MIFLSEDPTQPYLPFYTTTCGIYFFHLIFHFFNKLYFQDYFITLTHNISLLKTSISILNNSYLLTSFHLWKLN